jgi:hypothetical protein
MWHIIACQNCYTWRRVANALDDAKVSICTFSMNLYYPLQCKCEVDEKTYHDCVKDWSPCLVHQCWNHKTENYKVQIEDIMTLKLQKQVNRWWGQKIYINLLTKM